MPEPEKKNPFQKIVNLTILLGFIMTVGGLLLSWSNERSKRVLLEDQVRRNTELLEEYNPELISYRLDEIDKNLVKINDNIGEVLKLVLNQ